MGDQSEAKLARVVVELWLRIRILEAQKDYYMQQLLKERKSLK